jgi:outer membrane protein OmpA-like peptidoglycan-associated protein
MKTTTIIFLLLCFLFSLPISSQIIDVKGKIKNQSINRANQRTDQGIDKGLDKMEEGVVNIFKGDKDEEKKEEKSVEEDSDNNKAENDESSSKKQDEPKLESYSKFDFIPGEKVIFFDDFSQDAVGDFPLLWNTNGTAEVVTTNLFPGHWMKFDCNESIWTDNLLELPDNYTIEFDVVPIPEENGKMRGYNVRLMQAVNVKAWDHGSAPGKGGFLYTIEYTGRPTYATWFYNEDCRASALRGYKEDAADKQKENQKYHVSIWVQKSRIRLYQNQNKLIDLPKAFPTECLKIDRLRFEYGAAMVSNVRIAVGAPDMRSKLLTEGKLVSYGIYFDVNKDVVKPESHGTLKEIAKILEENPDVKIKIVGHTDADGADAANLDLSKRRGESVKQELVKTFGIDKSRIESDGMGEGEPVAPNDTPANKALNRRVEFIKL